MTSFHSQINGKISVDREDQLATITGGIFFPKVTCLIIIKKLAPTKNNDFFSELVAC